MCKSKGHSQDRQNINYTCADGLEQDYQEYELPEPNSDDEWDSYPCIIHVRILRMPGQMQVLSHTVKEIHPEKSLLMAELVYVVPPQSWGDRSDTKHSKCLLLGGRRLNQLTLIPKPKGSGGTRAAMAQVGPANNRNDTKRCLPIEASLRPGEAVPW